MPSDLDSTVAYNVMAASTVGGRAENRAFVRKVICCARALAAGRRSHRPATALRTTLARRRPAAALVLHRPPRQCNTEGRHRSTSVRAAVCRTPQSSRRDRLDNIIIIVVYAPVCLCARQ